MEICSPLQVRQCYHPLRFPLGPWRKHTRALGVRSLNCEAPKQFQRWSGKLQRIAIDTAVRTRSESARR
eukprot:10269717-Alexandrium_andersonii.AAC.1